VPRFTTVGDIKSERWVCETRSTRDSSSRRDRTRQLSVRLRSVAYHINQVSLFWKKQSIDVCFSVKDSVILFSEKNTIHQSGSKQSRGKNMHTYGISITKTDEKVDDGILDVLNNQNAHDDAKVNDCVFEILEDQIYGFYCNMNDILANLDDEGQITEEKVNEIYPYLKYPVFESCFIGGRFDNNLVTKDGRNVNIEHSSNIDWEETFEHIAFPTIFMNGKMAIETPPETSRHEWKKFVTDELLSDLSGNEHVSIIDYKNTSASITV